MAAVSAQTFELLLLTIEVSYIHMYAIHRHLHRRNLTVQVTPRKTPDTRHKIPDTHHKIPDIRRRTAIIRDTRHLTLEDRRQVQLVRDNERSFSRFP